MSFSSNVKEELSRHISKSRHCQISEIAAIISFCGRMQADVHPCYRTGHVMDTKDNYWIRIQTENIAVARKYFTLIKKAFQINAKITIRQNHNLNADRTYIVTVGRHEDSIRVLQAIKVMDGNGAICEKSSLTDNLIIQQTCCKRAFIRGAFLAMGSISDPVKFYHFEIVCTSEKKAEQLKAIINNFQIDAKIVQRKKYYVIYIKEGAMIVDILNVMEAHIALMNLENVRILKEMRNSVNRKVNCETANINKTVSAAVKQIEDIRYIQRQAGLHGLSDGLEEVAMIRLGNPDASLKELGMMLNPQVGKSGVNHRLRKLSNLANELREKKGGAVS